MKKNVRAYIPLIIIAGIIIILDQLTKYWVRSALPLGEVWLPWPATLPFVRIVHWSNTGAAFGIFQGFGNVFTLLAVVVAIAIFYYYPMVPNTDWTLRLAMGLQLGGAIGNMIDRLTIGHVTDFVWIGSFPVFNVADSSITVGVAVLLLGILLQERRERLNRPAVEPEVETIEVGSNMKDHS